MVTGDESALRALQASRIIQLNKVISDIANCTRKRDVNKVLEAHYETESERQRETHKAGIRIRDSNNRDKG
ncbi:MAG: hypothetical protein COB66_07920 [Coxiella sp. (in: Bacteria)]|nr:MAG: hypothetical protein COB66_07920 [Coxiella sp. (in: g-proteobacteria)]